MRSARLRAGHRPTERRLAAADVGQTPWQLDQVALVEAGADLARVHQQPALVNTQQERAQADARAGRIGEAADDELLTVQALDLQPVPAAAVAVDAVGQLADHSLQALLASGAEERLAATLYVLAEAQVRGGGRRRQQSLEHAFACDQRRRPQVVTIQVEQIESDVGQRRAQGGPLAVRGESLLEALETGAAVGQQGDDLAVEQRLPCRHRGDGRGRAREAPAPVLSSARDEPHLAGVQGAQGAIAVELHLVDPRFAGRRRVGQRRQLRRHVGGHGALPGAGQGGRVQARLGPAVADVRRPGLRSGGRGRVGRPARRRSADAAAVRMPGGRARVRRHLSTVRPLSTLPGWAARTSSPPGLAAWSFSLISSHWSASPRSRTSTQPPCSLRPRRRNFSSPLASPAAGSPSGSHVPASQTITAPAPYSPPGMTPSKGP